MTSSWNCAYDGLQNFFGSPLRDRIRDLQCSRQTTWQYLTTRLTRSPHLLIYWPTWTSGVGSSAESWQCNWAVQLSQMLKEWSTGQRANVNIMSQRPTLDHGKIWLFCVQWWWPKVSVRYLSFAHSANRTSTTSTYTVLCSVVAKTCHSSNTLFCVHTSW